MTKRNTILKIKDLEIKYSDAIAVHKTSIDIEEGLLTAIIGKSGCGKSSMLRCINRMNEFIDNCIINGEILLNDENIISSAYDVIKLRKKIGMVFQKPNPFPISIKENVLYGLKIHNIKHEEDEILETILTQCGLWDEVKDKLEQNGCTLSGGQQQRLCIARTLAIQPKILLMDEPCASLDPISTAIIENLMYELSAKQNITIILVSHSMQQVSRVSKRVIFMNAGKMIEYNNTSDFFTNPKSPQSLDYITGR